jgi:hypothetical protein
MDLQESVTETRARIQGGSKVKEIELSRISECRIQHSIWIDKQEFNNLLQLLKYVVPISAKASRYWRKTTNTHFMKRELDSPVQ